MKQKKYSRPQIKKTSDAIASSKVCCGWNTSCGSAVKGTKSSN